MTKSNHPVSIFSKSILPRKRLLLLSTTLPLMPWSVGKPCLAKDIYLVLVYGVIDYPMMLETNKELKSREDVIRIARLYFSRWRIEEYFRCKKQIFQFEHFRVRKEIYVMHTGLGMKVLKS